jgi:hypothetical protein
MAQSSEIDSRGHFVIEGLVGGEYELNLYIYMPPQPGIPAARPQTTRRRVTVPDSGEVVVSIMLDLNPQTERNP